MSVLLATTTAGAAEASGRHPDAFKPWGFGVRACVGMQFALWEAKVLVSMMYHHFTFTAPDDLVLKPSTKDSFPGVALEVSGWV
jgi:cytochrome P450